VRSAAYVTPETLPARARAWLAAARATAAPRPGLRLDPTRCALLVIDMVRYFADPGGRCFLPAAAAVTPRIAALLAAWRAGGGLVVFTRHAHRGPEDLGMLGRFFSDWIRDGAPESEVVPALAPAPGEAALRKTTYDAFLGTDLEDRLRAAGCGQVLVTGVLTHMCCETTARAAFCRGFEVYVAADAAADASEERHVASLAAMADAVAVILGADEALDACNTAWT
jgi:nicotinamidase-related amidase